MITGRWAKSWMIVLLQAEITELHEDFRNKNSHVINITLIKESWKLSHQTRFCLNGNKIDYYSPCWDPTPISVFPTRGQNRMKHQSLMLNNRTGINWIQSAWSRNVDPPSNCCENFIRTRRQGHSGSAKDQFEQINCRRLNFL